MTGISTSDERNRMLRDEPEKLRQELADRQRELGLQRMVPQHGQDELRQLEDIGEESNHIREQMQSAKEARLRRQAEERKAKRKSAAETLRLILMHEERKLREAFDSRRQSYASADGWLDGFGHAVRMLSFRVLLKELPLPSESEGIVLAGGRREGDLRFSVESVGDGCEELSEGDVVVVEPYAGIELALGRDRYRIVSVLDIVARLEQ